MRSYESPSSLNLYIECPKKYWFNYIEKPDIEEEKHLYFALGTAFHSAMEFLYGEVKKSNRFFFFSARGNHRPGKTRDLFKSQYEFSGAGGGWLLAGGYDLG